jgi:hypothetical protein
MQASTSHCRWSRRRSLDLAPVIALSCALAMTCEGRADAQYFGQNKVQYETFDFQVLRTENFDVYYYPEEKAGIELAARMAERWNARLSRVLNHRLSSRQPLIMYASSTDFQQTNVIGGPIGEGTGGVTESLRRRIILPFAGPLSDTDHVIGHELVHAYQYDISAQQARGGRRIAGVGVLPLWFIEGMAEYLSIGPRSPLTSMWLRDAITRETLPSIRDLNNPRYFPYRWGHALWAFIGGRWGDDSVVKVLSMAIDSGNTEDAFKAVLGMSEEELTAAWHAALREAYGRFTSQTRPAQSYGRVLTPKEGLGNELNVSPSLSPDGRRVAFLSERGLFSIDLYVADVESGEVVRRLTSTAVDPHFESLQFISSAGAWDAKGRQLAVTAVSSGAPVLTIYNVETGDRTREIPLRELDGALNPTWSPDGRRVALVGMTGGLTDLFLVDLESGALTRATSDAFAELQPAWSPDGARIAFATDRFTTSLDQASAGTFRLATIDVNSREVRPVASFERGKHIGPQWAADGNSMFFVADPNGISNVYRVPLDAASAGDIRQITSVMSGVSGITESSPAISAAAGRVVFTAFDDGAYRLHLIDSPDTLAGTAPVNLDDDAALLPPTRAERRTITSLLTDTTTGLPPQTTAKAWTTEPYRTGLQLEAVGQPTVAVGADRFGTFGGGGVSLYFSDLLGDHNLLTAFQATTTFDDEFSANDLGGAVMYTNRRHRWNWGIALDQTPYRTGYVSETLAAVDDVPALVQETIISRQTDRGVTGMVAYPLSRAQRFEMSAGYRQLRFDNRAQTTAFALDTGELLLDQREDLPSLGGLNLAQTSAALVYDTSSFGATSPVLGQRYRAEVSPMFGDLQYAGVLLDYRRYFMPVQLYTIAARVLHYGRYGGDSEDPRLFPLFMGYPSLVRGYDVGTFDPEECPPTPDNSCERFDRLIGSRMLVANLELRFPLLRPFGLREGVYGPVPVEMALFADGGIAWSKGDRPSLFGGDREGVSSVGAALRVNALGYAVLQFDIAKPLQRQGRGWIFQFSMAPGF